MIIIIIIFIKKITMKIKFKNNFLKEKVIGFVLIVKMLILLLGNFAIDVNYLKLSLKVYLKLTFKCLILILLVIIIKIKKYILSMFLLLYRNNMLNYLIKLICIHILIKCNDL